VKLSGVELEVTTSTQFVRLDRMAG